jgi:hypothetical protein
VVDIQDALYNLKLNGYSVRISGSAHHRAFQELSLGPDLFVRRQGAVDWAHIVRPPAYFPRVRTEQPGLLFIPAVQKAAITVVGHTTVGGQPTTHYRAVEPYSTYLEAEGLQTTTSGGSVTTDLFLDGHGLPWRVAQSLPAAGSTLRTVRVYSAYRSTVALRPPPASRVIGSVTVRDQTELASELGKATGER